MLIHDKMEKFTIPLVKMSQQTIKITIDGKTHEFMSGDHQAMKNMAWQDRKKLIDLLETIKQAEYVKEAKSPEIETEKLTSTPTIDPEFKTNKNNSDQPDHTVKPGQGDVDALMNRLILEDKKHQSNIPDKSVVIKWMLIILAVVLLIAVIF